MSAFAATPHLIRSTHRVIACLLLATLVSCQGLKPASRSSRVDAQIAASLEKAHLALQVIAQQDPASPAAQEAHADYDAALVRLLNSLQQRNDEVAWARDRQLEGSQAWHLTFESRTSQDAHQQQRQQHTWSPAGFARCDLASEVKLRHFNHVFARDGLGVAVVLVQDDPTRATRPFRPAEGEFVPATAVLEFTASPPGQPAGARLRFYNPLKVSHVSVGRRTQQLAENLTAPLQFSLAEDYFNEREGQLGTLSGGEEEGHLFYLTPYDPTKIPVVFLHGVRSYAGMWKNMINELLADPELRRRYQPVCFNYSPAMPIPASAACLRRLMQKSRDTLDPEHDDAVLRRTVIVGHSMGGLLARLQVTDSGTDFWHAFFASPPEELAPVLDGDSMEVMRDSLFFRRQPEVKEVVFICTPHRGSELADVNVIRTVLRLVLFLPKQIQRPLKALANLPKPYIRPELRDFRAFGLAGPDNATTRHPFFKALARHPVGVPFHSIIAVGKGKEPLTDGVVPYWSAHLDGAVSETVIHKWHSCLWEPETVEAVLRILKDARERQETQARPFLNLRG